MSYAQCLNLMVGPTTGLKFGVILLKGRASDGARTHDCKCNRPTPRGGWSNPSQDSQFKSTHSQTNKHYPKEIRELYSISEDALSNGELLNF